MIEPAIRLSFFDSERDPTPRPLELTWAQLVEALGEDRPQPCTLATCGTGEHRYRDAKTGLLVDGVCRYKYGQAWCVGAFPAGTERRSKKAVEAVHVLGLDLDGLDNAALARLLAALESYRVILHSTHGDRDDKRKVRAVVALSRPVPGADWDRFWPAAVAALGIADIVDTQCRDATRLMFLPSHPSDRPRVFAAQDGQTVDVEAVLATAGPVHVNAAGPAHAIAVAAATGDDARAEAVKALAAAWPQRGRHTACLALLGALVTAGWEDDEAAEFVACVMALGPGDERLPFPSEHAKQITQARRTREKITAGEAVTGWGTLIDACGVAPAAVDTARRALGMAGAPAFAAAFATALAPTPKHVPIDDVRAGLTATRNRLSRSSKQENVAAAKILTTVLAGKPLATDDPDVVDRAVCAVVLNAPPGATAEQLAGILARSAASTLPDALIVKIGQATEALGLVTTPVAQLVADGEIVTDEDLRARLLQSREGPRACGPNVEMILRFSAETRGRIRWNDLTKQVEVLEPCRFATENPSDLPVGIANWMASDWQVQVSTGMVGEQILRVARAWHAYDPVVDYLRVVKWDGTPRIGGAGSSIGGWLATYCGVNPMDYPPGYIERIGSRWLISAVARGLAPGCKVDTVLVLQGAQGAKKSSALAALGGEWFSDTPLVLGDKDSRMMASYKWIIELAELASIRNPSDVESHKAFLSQARDDFRPPYGRAVESFARHCVFAGTVNPEQFLHDDTGNRRYWIAHVGREIDLEGIRRDRDQLWAEAVVRFDAGERWWFERDEQRDADAVAAGALTENGYVDTIMAWWQTLPLDARRVSLSDVACKALLIPKSDVDRYTTRVTRAMREAGFIREKNPTVSGEGKGGGERSRKWFHRGTIQPEVACVSSSSPS